MSKIILKTSLFTMLLAGILFACQHDIDEPDGDGQLSVAGARAWYEAHKPDYLILKSGQGNGKETLVKPNWKNAREEENSKVRAVTVNLLTNRGFGFSNADSKKAFDETKEFGYMISLTQLVILKDKKTGNTVGFLMTHIGDKSCLEKSKFDLRKGNSYLKKDKDFDGMVIYHDLEGKFVNGWKFLKGTVTHTVKFPENQKVEVNLKNAQSNCFTEYVTEWWYVKQYDSYAGVGDDMEYKGTDYDWITVTYATTVCYWDGDGGGSSSDGGGSDSGGYNPDIPNSDSDPVVSSYGNLNDTQRTLFESKLNQFKNENCGSQAIYNALIDKGFKFNVEMNSSIGTSAGYDPSTKTIQYKDNSPFDNISSTREELVHAFQDSYYPGGTYQYVSNGHQTIGYSNIEFEAKLLIDLNTTGCCSVFNNYPSIKNLYIEWLELIRNNGFNIDNYDYDHWLKEFNKYHPEYSSPLSDKLKSPAALNSISSLFCTY